MFLFLEKQTNTGTRIRRVSELMDAIPCDHDTPGIALRWLGGLSKENIKNVLSQPFPYKVIIIYVCLLFSIS